MDCLTQGRRGGRIAHPCVLSRRYQYLPDDHFQPEAAEVIAAAPVHRRFYCLQSQSMEVMAAIYWDWTSSNGHPHLRAMTLHRAALSEQGRAQVVRSSARLAIRTVQYMAQREGLGCEIFADAGTLGLAPVDLLPLGFTQENHRWVLTDSIGRGGRLGAMVRLAQLRATGVLR